MKQKNTPLKLTQFKKISNVEETSRQKLLLIEDSNFSIDKDIKAFADKFPLYIN